MKRYFITLLLGLCCSAGSGQTFKKHTIGESAEQFFSIATINGAKTADYCKTRLSDPNALKAYEKWQRNPMDSKAREQSIDVAGCKDIQGALEGREVEFTARYADEIAKGEKAQLGSSVKFRHSKLVLLVFYIDAELQDVIKDVSKELNGAEPVLTAHTMQNAYGAKLQQRRATWKNQQLSIELMETRDFRDPKGGVLFFAADSAYIEQEEGERQANRPSTIE